MSQERADVDAGEAVSFPFYKAPTNSDGVPRPREPVLINSMARAGLDNPAYYQPHADLAAAVNTALLLGLPLLVTGEPGCGKTQLGLAIAHALGYRHELFETKSTSQARDVFYVYDVVGRFQAGQLNESGDPRHYIEYTALGKAILLAHPKSNIAHLLPPESDDGLNHPGVPLRSVVVIDEVDKAPRDFPNDLLNEIERMYFKIPELGAAGVRGTPSGSNSDQRIADYLRPVVVLTSNSEKKLPDAFLRRCVYFHIPDPDESHLREIVDARLGEFLDQPKNLPDRPMLKDALEFYAFLRGRSVSLGKKPGIAELLNWLQALIGHGASLQEPLAGQEDIVANTMSVILKTSEDLRRRRSSDHEEGLFSQWLTEHKQNSG